MIPQTLQKDMVKLAHVGHQGMTKTKELLRTYAWFPGMNQMVEDLIRRCTPCLANGCSSRRDPIQPSPTPDGVWENLCMDFDGPFPNGKYIMVLIDEYSKYPIAEIVNSTSAAAVTPRLLNIFALFGIPKSIKTDGGPPFNGSQFSEFCVKLGVFHKKITPLWPEANGRAEHFMATLNKTVKALILEGKNWETHLPEFLMQYRATPHSATRLSPAPAVLRCKFKTFLPDFRSPQQDELDEQLKASDAASKAKMKEYADKKRRTQPHDIVAGDQVLVRLVFGG